MTKTKKIEGEKQNEYLSGGRLKTLRLIPTIQQNEEVILSGERLKILRLILNILQEIQDNENLE